MIFLQQIPFEVAAKCIFSCKEHQTVSMFVFHSFVSTPTALAEEENQGEPRQVLDDVSQVRSAVDDSFHNGALVLCNPGASNIPDTDPQFPEQQREVHPHAAAPQESRDCEVARGMGVVKACKCESHSMDITEISKDSTCVGHLGKADVSHLYVPWSLLNSAHVFKIWSLYVTKLK